MASCEVKSIICQTLLQVSSGSVTFPANTLVVGAAHMLTAMVSRLPAAIGRADAAATVTITAVGSGGNKLSPRHEMPFD